jgi:carboxymethylenebutenolidase
MNTSDVTFTRAGDTLKAYAVWPDVAGKRPGIVLIPDVRGLSEHYRDVARRLAGEGYFTLAVDLYSREGTPEFADMPAVFRWMRQLPDTRVLSDLGSAVGYLAGRPEVDAAAVGITGWCMGGQYALMAACVVPGVAACVSWYGMLRYAEKDAVKPASPLDLAPELGCPYLGLFGEEDAIIPLADVEELRDPHPRGEALRDRDLSRRGPRLLQRHAAGCVSTGSGEGRLGSHAQVLREASAGSVTRGA